MSHIVFNRCFIFIFAAIISLSGCIYLADTQQGNVIEPEKLAQVKRGQSQEQVQYLLGTPVIQDPLHPNRWDYVFYFVNGTNGDKTYERATIVFNRGAVSDIILQGTAPSGGRLDNNGQPLNLDLTLDTDLS